jgi:hypothetical protein
MSRRACRSLSAGAPMPILPISRLEAFSDAAV